MGKREHSAQRFGMVDFSEAFTVGGQFFGKCDLAEEVDRRQIPPW